MNSPFVAVVSALAIWRLTHLLQADDGPWNLMARLRFRAGTGFWGELLDCFYCLSLWIAAPFAVWLGTTAGERLLLWPALSAAAILLERATAPPESPTVSYFEEPEGDDGVLRKEPTVRGDDRV